MIYSMYKINNYYDTHTAEAMTQLEQQVSEILGVMYDSMTKQNFDSISDAADIDTDKIDTDSIKLPYDNDNDITTGSTKYEQNTTDILKDTDTITKINHVPHKTIVYNDNGMFSAKLMNGTPIEIFIDGGAMPSILLLHMYNNFPILHKYPSTESNTPIHAGGGLIKSHFWLQILLKLNHKTIQMKALVCDSESPYDLILG